MRLSLVVGDTLSSQTHMLPTKKAPTSSALGSLLFKKYPGEQQVKFKVKIEVPGSWVDAGLGTCSRARVQGSVNPRCPVLVLAALTALRPCET